MATAGITGMGTTYNLPNFAGDIISLTPEDTPLLSSIGGLNGGKQTTSVEFEWQTYDLRDPNATRQRLEGADAPGAEERVRQNWSNITEIHQEKVDISYTKQAAFGQLSGLNNAQTNPVTNEVSWQLDQQLKQVKRDIEVSFLSGSYQKPADNTTARKTRGIIPAITSNVVTADAPTGGGTATGDVAAITKDMIDELVQTVYTNGGVMEGGTAVLMVPPKYRSKVSNLYASQFGQYQETSRNIAGVAVKQLETDFMVLNLMTNRHLAQVAPDTLLLLSLEQLNPVFLEIPGKGHFFLEELAKTGASTKYQLYGEIGLAYGNERQHGKLVFTPKA